MSTVSTHQPGTFCWVDLATTDTAAAKGFYMALFGWTAEDLPAGEGVYTMLRKGDRQVAALFALPPEMGDAPRWQAYALAGDLEQAVRTAADLGGAVLMPPCDVMDAGRMATLQDPTGAVFNLWQPGAHAGADLANEPGAQCWLELQTRDPARAAPFYAGLFGWTVRDSASVTGTRYEIFSLDGREVAGMIPITDEWGPVPPNWSVYFGVEDCDAAIARAGQLGGRVVFPPMDIAGVGRFAFLQDPMGAVFAVIALSHAPA